ncbi:uncharacterized protein EI90DRAFT_3011653 [Cantharellus anzutake]|uniref:uncharacterized protein n=1 Tax=Cantharellus anzutake TaxID=1750568 RepID=UPI001907DE5D|nr:uncharacterized protein EI90DRAFT_3011653 [Cantharellus anzutake]KAF8342108.1 hypothetical protein EI90DRAFT_3011653 [Cantharellus anzutake]
MAPSTIPTVVRLKTIKFGPEIELEGPGLFHFGYFGQFGHFWWICPQEVAKLNVDHLLIHTAWLWTSTHQLNTKHTTPEVKRHIAQLSKHAVYCLILKESPLRKL